jgi:hypothetical protein
MLIFSFIAAADHQRPAGVDRQTYREGSVMAGASDDFTSAADHAARFEIEAGDTRNAAGSNGPSWPSPWVSSPSFC